MITYLIWDQFLERNFEAILKKSWTYFGCKLKYVVHVATDTKGRFQTLTCISKRVMATSAMMEPHLLYKAKTQYVHLYSIVVGTFYKLSLQSTPMLKSRLNVCLI